MRWIPWLLIILGVVAIAVAIDQLRGRTATLSWDYDYTTNPPCEGSAHRAPAGKICVAGFNTFYGIAEGRSGQQFVSNNFDRNGRPVGKGISAKLTVHWYGDFRFCATSLGRDENGHTTESLPLCTHRWLLPFGIGQH